MITEEKLANYKRLALKSVASRANNPAAPGIALVQVTPHDLLLLLENYHTEQTNAIPSEA